MSGPDYNADGRADLTLGAWRESVGSKAASGAANVIPGSTAGPSSAADQFWHQDSSGVAGGAEAEDRFASTLTHGDYDGDGFGDVAIGVPGETVGTTQNAGAVAVLYGSSRGLNASRDQVFYEGADGLGGTRGQGESFGNALASGDFDGDGTSDLAIGVGLGEVEGVGVAGSVSVLYGGEGGLSGERSEIWSQATPGMEDEPESGDVFGASLASGDFNGDASADLAIGVTGEIPADGTFDTGAIAIVLGTPTGLTAIGNRLILPSNYTAFSGRHLGWTLAAGDFDADADDDLASGVPFYGDLDGAVVIYEGGPSGVDPATERILQQGGDGIGGAAEDYDNFGTSLAADDFNDDGAADLAIGALFEDVGTTVNAGAVNVIYGSATGLTGEGDQLFYQGIVSGAREKDDRFGERLASGDYNGDGKADLSVGTPFEDVGSAANAGCVNVIYGTDEPSGLTVAGNRSLTQNTSGITDLAERNDNLSWALL